MIDIAVLQKNIKALEMQNAQAQALRDSAMKEVCTLLSCDEAGLDNAMLSLQKRRDAATRKLSDLEAKIVALIPDDQKVFLGV